jgi:hypothetical protein
MVWPKNTIFTVYREKFRKKSDVAQMQDLNQVPHGEAAADIAKMFEQKSDSAKNDFCDFCCDNPQTPDFCSLPRKLAIFVVGFDNFL